VLKGTHESRRRAGSRNNLVLHHRCPVSLAPEILVYASHWVETLRDAVVDRHSLRLAVHRHSPCVAVDQYGSYVEADRHGPCAAVKTDSTCFAMDTRSASIATEIHDHLSHSALRLQGSNSVADTGYQCLAVRKESSRRKLEEPRCCTYFAGKDRPWFRGVLMTIVWTEEYWVREEWMDRGGKR
jgi:hypothetical protein